MCVLISRGGQMTKPRVIKLDTVSLVVVQLSSNWSQSKGNRYPKASVKFRLQKAFLFSSSFRIHSSRKNEFLDRELKFRLTSKLIKCSGRTDFYRLNLPISGQNRSKSIFGKKIIFK